MILAIDPGNVTGVSRFDTYTLQPPHVEEVPGGLYGFVEWWEWSAWRHSYPEQVFIEDFIIRPDTHRKTREPAVYETLGWVKGKCHELSIPCMPIGPAEHTPFSGYKKKSTSKIRRLGWSAPSKDMHADSASSVLLLGLTRTHKEIATQLLKEIAQ